MLELKWFELRQNINELWLLFLNWILSFEEAEKKAKPYIDEVNNRWHIIAKEYWKKYKPITFANTCR